MAGEGNGGRNRVGRGGRQQSTIKQVAATMVILAAFNVAGSATAAWGAMRTDDNGGCNQSSLNAVVCIQ
jgi:hypothetical protein